MSEIWYAAHAAVRAHNFPLHFGAGFHLDNMHDDDVGSIAFDMSSLARRAEALRQRANAPHRKIDAVFVRRLIKLRRQRDALFGPDLFADPAWDIILDLTAAALEDRYVSISSLCIAAAVPTTSALRHIRSMQIAGLLERRPDPDDARRSFIGLVPATYAASLSWLQKCATATERHL